MKKIYIIIMLAILGMRVNAQITLEHTYDSASTYGGSGFIASQLVYVKLDVSGEKYLNINKTGKYISVYNLNHSLMKKISYDSFPQACNGIATFLYFSENLFGNDNLMEFMYVWGDCPGASHTRIYKEDGTCIFSADSMAPWVNINVQQLQYPIFNTSQGTKMILSHQSNGTAKLYSLPGTLNTAIQEANNQLMQAQRGQLSNLYPNPSNGTVTLQYELPKGETEGELILYNMQGTEVKRYKVDNTFKDVLIDNTQLPAGTYFYQLQTTGESSGGKKMVVIK